MAGKETKHSIVGSKNVKIIQNFAVDKHTEQYEATTGNNKTSKMLNNNNHILDNESNIYLHDIVNITCTNVSSSLQQYKLMVYSIKYMCYLKKT